MEQEETGLQIDVRTFISKWLEGDGHNHQHANDDVQKENPTCNEQRLNSDFDIFTLFIFKFNSFMKDFHSPDCIR